MNLIWVRLRVIRKFAVLIAVRLRLDGHGDQERGCRRLFRNEIDADDFDVGPWVFVGTEEGPELGPALLG